MIIMRTTVSINDELLARAKARAQADGRTLGSYIEEVLRQHLATPERTPQDVHLTISRATGGAQPGVDLTTNRGLYDAMGVEVA